MRRILLFAGCASLLGAVGCAGTYEEERRAQYHQQKADYAAANREYYKAAREQRKADEARARAVQDCYEEGDCP